MRRSLRPLTRLSKTHLTGLDMYFPYFRGKQFELISVRENAERFAQAGFVPVIEPVRESFGGLEKSLKAVCDAGGSAVVVVNPFHGDHSENGEGISNLLKAYLPKREIAAGVLLTAEMKLDEVVSCLKVHEDHNLTLLHAGFTQGKALAEAVAGNNVVRHLFLGSEDPLYRRNFKGQPRVLVRDGFKRRKRNLDYPPVEFFSVLHASFEEEGMDGFGDFLTVGDEFQESGGPAYSIAIHLTYIDPDDEDRMFVYHFKSLRSDTPADPAGKFAEALSALIETINRGDSKVLETEAVLEFRSLHARGHFPGLGYVKKLSMQHHIETLAAFLRK